MSLDTTRTTEEILRRVQGEFLEMPYPARSCVQVAALPMGALIEIEVVAATRL
jgi:2-iminobutanoate/2-iminopropanoate deaminase